MEIERKWEDAIAKIEKRHEQLTTIDENVQNIATYETANQMKGAHYDKRKRLLKLSWH